MSQNLLVALEQEDHDLVIRPMILTRFVMGLTHSAVLSKGDIIDFDGIDCTIDSIRHKYGSRDIAPNTDVYGSFHRPLANFEIERLITLGFKDLKSGDPDV